MKQNLTDALAAWIANGARSIGQIQISPLANGQFELQHVDDIARRDLEPHSGVSDARALSFFDDAGNYRPLKTAPTLRHGWLLRLASVAELRAALDHFYPAMTAIWLSNQEGRLNVVPLRETLNRQTGMYAATKRLLDDEGQQLVGRACAAENCIKLTLWPFAQNQPLSCLPKEKTTLTPQSTSPGHVQIPLLCHEACNILVAACREVVKTRERAAAPPAPEGAGTHQH